MSDPVHDCFQKQSLRVSLSWTWWPGCNQLLLPGNTAQGMGHRGMGWGGSYRFSSSTCTPTEWYSRRPRLSVSESVAVSTWFNTEHLILGLRHGARTRDCLGVRVHLL